METTYAFFKHGAPSVGVLVALFVFWADLNGDIQEIRAEMVENDQAIRAEMNAGFQAVRVELSEVDQSIRAELSDTNERLARVETRLTSVERILYSDIDPQSQ